MYETTTEQGAKIYIYRGGSYPFVKVTVPWDEVFLVGLSDMHIGGGFEEEEAFKTRRWILERENVLVSLGGDIIQNGNKRVGDMVFKLDMVPKEQKLYAAEFFKPVQSRIVGSVPGNHENWSFRDTGDDMMHNILVALGGLEWANQFYVGPELFLALCNKDDSVCYTVYQTHGATFHKNSGLAVNHFRMNTGDWLGYFDVRMRGHSHDLDFSFENVIVPDPRKGRVDTMENYVVLTGHYQGRPESYVASSGLRPKPHGAMAIKFDMRGKYKGSVQGVRV